MAEVESILTQIFGVYPSLNSHTAAERAQFTLEEFVHLSRIYQ